MKKLKQFWCKFNHLLNWVWLFVIVCGLGLIYQLQRNQVYVFLQTPWFLICFGIWLVLLISQIIHNNLKLAVLLMLMSFVLLCFGSQNAISSGSLGNLGFVRTGDKYNQNSNGNVNIVNVNYHRQRYVFIYHNIGIYGYDELQPDVGLYGGRRYTLGPQQVRMDVYQRKGLLYHRVTKNPIAYNLPKISNQLKDHRRFVLGRFTNEISRSALVSDWYDIRNIDQLTVNQEFSRLLLKQHFPKHIKLKALENSSGYSTTLIKTNHVLIYNDRTLGDSAMFYEDN